ncbi:Neuronal cell adhesion molecule [Pseudolycoriella hygida]|uniref:Neuronal cell adhesion molecule n=1 Tax=Pseudolycoriella hygida TaxID=35572 RepID=A0A9Q0S9Q5_9DIPT|nr:Neuronal cell adhesion molecule [Pseudolycoriella hygida]
MEHKDDKWKGTQCDKGYVHPLIQVPNQLVGAPVGTDVTLVCNAEASPKAINYWQRENGEMIIPNDRYSMTETDNSMYAVQMVLIIKKLQKSDFGGYKCISKNSIGGIEATIRLYVSGILKSVNNPNVYLDPKENASKKISDSQDENQGY